jgi:hypothetical protein
MEEREIILTVVELLGYFLFILSELIGLSKCKANAVTELLVKPCLNPQPNNEEHELV